MSIIIVGNFFLWFAFCQQNISVEEMEREMNGLSESADLFEVNVHDYKQLKACRRYNSSYFSQ